MRKRSLSLQQKRLAAQRPVTEPTPARQIVIRLKPGTRIPAPPAERTGPIHRQHWLVSVEMRRFPIDILDEATGEETTVWTKMRFIVASTSGGPDCFPNHWRIWFTIRKGSVTQITLASSFTGTDGSWHREQSMSMNEAARWLDARANGRGMQTIEACLAQ